MSIIQKARELGAEIAESQELKDYRAAEASVLANEEATQLIREFQQKQRNIQIAQAQGKQPTEEQKAELRVTHENMMANPVVREFLQAKQRFEQTINMVNQILQQAITGNAGCSPSG
ncbi:MAG: YlbF family regulator [Peptococcaceae bacterium]|nr:YlbF family regulator [Peptococcaceae bacterium]